MEAHLNTCDLLKISLNPTLLHEYCHAKKLQNNLENNCPFIVLAPKSDHISGHKRSESFYRENIQVYRKYYLAGMNLYIHHKYPYFTGVGRADVDNRTVLTKEQVISAATAPQKLGISLLYFLIAFIIITKILISVNVLIGSVLGLIAFFIFIHSFHLIVGFWIGGRVGCDEYISRYPEFFINEKIME